MNTELRSNILSANTVKGVMPSCIVYALVQSMTFMVDTIVAGQVYIQARSREKPLRVDGCD